MGSPKEEKTSFTVDAEMTGNTMPSVSKLLNRKRFEKSKASAPLPKDIPAGLSLSPPEEISISSTSGVSGVVLVPDAAVQMQSSSPPPPPQRAVPAEIPVESDGPTRLQVKPVGNRSERRGQARIIAWTLQQLQNGGDPMGKGLAFLLAKGAQHAVFLAVQTSAGGGTPVFKASACVTEDRSRLVLWTGLTWDPKLIPEVWAHFVKNGWLEFPPPGTMTQAQSTRNVLRAAFGISGQEWLTLMRVGPSNACRGVIALVSPNTLTAAIPGATPLIQAPIRTTGNAA